MGSVGNQRTAPSSHGSDFSFRRLLWCVKHARWSVQSKAFVGNKGGLGAGNAAFAGVAAGIAVAAIAVGVFLSKSSGSPQGQDRHNFPSQHFWSEFPSCSNLISTIATATLASSEPFEWSAPPKSC